MESIQQWRVAKPIADWQEQVTEWQIFFKPENTPWFLNKSSDEPQTEAL